MRRITVRSWLHVLGNETVHGEAREAHVAEIDSFFGRIQRQRARIIVIAHRRRRVAVSDWSRLLRY